MGDHLPPLTLPRRWLIWDQHGQGRTIDAKQVTRRKRRVTRREGEEWSQTSEDEGNRGRRGKIRGTEGKDDGLKKTYRTLPRSSALPTTLHTSIQSVRGGRTLASGRTSQSADAAGGETSQERGELGGARRRDGVFGSVFPLSSSSSSDMLVWAFEIECSPRLGRTLNRTIFLDVANQLYNNSRRILFEVGINARATFSPLFIAPI